MSKYTPLWEYIKKNNQEQYILTFEEIKKILNFDINHSFLTYKKEIENFGYKVEKIYMKEKKVKFIKKESRK